MRKFWRPFPWSPTIGYREFRQGYDLHDQPWKLRESYVVWAGEMDDEADAYDRACGVNVCFSSPLDFIRYKMFYWSRMWDFYTEKRYSEEAQRIKDSKRLAQWIELDRQASLRSQYDREVNPR